MKEKIANISVKIPIKKAGNVIVQEFVPFDVFQDGQNYILVPQLTEEQLRIANLPVELRFQIQNGIPVSARGDRDGNFHVIQDAFVQLKKLHLLQMPGNG